MDFTVPDLEQDWGAIAGGTAEQNGKKKDLEPHFLDDDSFTFGAEQNKSGFGLE